jgi:hypothetical protein
MTPMFAAAGYSLIYLLLGGSLGGANLDFIAAKCLANEFPIAVFQIQKN